MIAVIAIGQTPCAAGLLGGLKNVRDLAPESKFEVDFFIAANSGGDVNTIGLDLELVEFDIINSKVNSGFLSSVVPLAGQVNPNSRVSFLPSVPFASWFDGSDIQRFGNTSGTSPSRAVFDAYVGGTSGVNLPDATEFLFGTFTVDYSGLGLEVGDSVTLDVSGVDDTNDPDGLLKTTAASVFPVMGDAKLINFEFGLIGESMITFTLTSSGGGGGVIPEPGSGLIFLGLAGLSWTTRRRRRSRSGDTDEVV